MYVVDTMDKACELAINLLGAKYVDKDEKASKIAGYSIYRNTEEFYDYICVLGNRIEVNFKNGVSKNIWIEKEENICRLKEEVEKQAYEIIKLKAKLYDLICGD